MTKDEKMRLLMGGSYSDTSSNTGTNSAREQLFSDIQKTSDDADFRRRRRNTMIENNKNGSNQRLEDSKNGKNADNQSNDSFFKRTYRNIADPTVDIFGRSNEEKSKTNAERRINELKYRYGVDTDNIDPEKFAEAYSNIKPVKDLRDLGNTIGAATQGWVGSMASGVGTYISPGLDSYSESQKDTLKAYNDYYNLGYSDDAFKKRSKEELDEYKLKKWGDQEIQESAQTKEAAKEGRGAVGQFLLDAAGTGTEMALDGVVKALTFGVGGFPALGLRTAGAVTSNLRMSDKEYADSKIALYGAVAGTVEVIAEKLFGGAAAMRAAYGKGWFSIAERFGTRVATSKAVQEALGTFGKELAYNIAKLGGQMAEEGLEEIFSDIVEPVYRKLIFDEWNEDGETGYLKSAFNMDTVRDGLLGAFMAFAGGGAVNAYTGTARGIDTARRNVESGNRIYDSVYETGLAQNEKSDAYISAKNVLERKGDALGSEINDQARRNVEAMEGNKISIRSSVDKAIEKAYQEGKNDPIAHISDGAKGYAVDVVAEKVESKTTEIMNSESVKARIANTGNQAEVENVAMAVAMIQNGAADSEAIETILTVPSGRAIYEEVTGEQLPARNDEARHAMEETSAFNYIAQREDVAKAAEAKYEEAKTQFVENNSQVFRTEGENAVREILATKEDSEYNDITPVMQDVYLQGNAVSDGATIDISSATDVIEKLDPAFREYARNNLTDDEIVRLYNAGVADNQSYMAIAKRRIAPRNTRRGGRVSYADSKGKRLSRSREKAYSKFAKLSGAEIVIHDHIELGGKKHNGYHINGVIHIALDSDRPLINVVKHEITHYLKEFSPKEYQELQDFVMEKFYNNDPARYRAAVMNKVAEYRGLDHKERFTINDAKEELLADATERFFMNQSSADEIVAYSRQLGVAIKNAITKVNEWLSEALSLDVEEYNATHKEEAKSMSFLANSMEIEDLRKAEAMWVKALDRAAQSDKIQEDINKRPADGTAYFDGKEIRASVPTEFQKLPKSDFGGGKGTLSNVRDALGNVTTVRVLRSEAFQRYHPDGKKIADSYNQVMNNMAKFLHDSFDKYQYIGLEDAYKAKVRYRVDENGKPISVVVSAMVKNAEYPVNFDLTSICKKRVEMQRVIDELVKKDENGNALYDELDLDAGTIHAINKILKSYGFETACPICFVETHRLEMQAYADKVTSIWNEAVLRHNPDAKPLNATSITREEIGKLQNDIDAAWKQYEKGFKAKKKELAKLNEGKSDKDKQPFTWDMKVDILTQHKGFQFTLSADDILSKEGNTTLKGIIATTKSGKKNKYNDFYGFIKQAFGTSAPKETTAFAPYNGEITSIKWGNNALLNYLWEIGGVRLQSFSDFQIQYVYDYLQIIGDLAARGLPAHAYTKEIAFAKLFGMTGMKINMSVVCDVDTRVDREHAGLRLGKNGYEYNIGDQSISLDEAVRLMNTPGYENIGTILVGLSRNHILMALDDNNISYIIPYHASGLPVDVRKMTHLNMATNYTDYQATKPLKKIGVPTGMNKQGEMQYTYHDVTNFKCDLYDFNEAYKRLGSWKQVITEFNRKQQNGGWKLVLGEAAKGGNTGDFDVYRDAQYGLDKTNDPAKTADAYIEDCMSKGYMPLFSEFADHPNYYKLSLFDFAVKDINGNCHPQEAVKPIFPSKFVETTSEVTYNESKRGISSVNVMDGNTDTDGLESIISYYMDEQNSFEERQSGKHEQAMDEIKANIDNIKARALELAEEEEHERNEVLDQIQIKRSISQDSKGNELSEGQQKYFKNSKVRDAQGRLMVMYHGTEHGGFTVFDPSRTDDGRSFFFTNSPSVARSYSGTSDTYVPSRTELSTPEEAMQYISDYADDEVNIFVNEDGNYQIDDETGFAVENADLEDAVQEYIEDYLGFGRNSTNYETYLNIQNPLIVDAKGNNWDELPNMFDENGDLMTTREYAEYAQENGYDGVIFQNITDSGLYANTATNFEEATNAVVFDSNQIKSVKNTDPTEHEDIRYSMSQDSEGNKLTKEQEEFFKDSKIRDEDGNLRVMYHGSQNNFTIFDLDADIVNGRIHGNGFYFTYDEDDAQSWADRDWLYELGEEDLPEDPSETTMYKTYLNIKNPFIFEDDDLMEDEEAFRQRLIREGYDGIIVPAYDEVIAFYPEQIKLTTNENPTENEDIRYSIADHPDQIGININDDSQPFTEQILSGKKTIETRNKPTLRKYVGKRIALVKTGKGKQAQVVGYATVSEEVEYNSAQEFRKDYKRHLVKDDDPKFGFKSKKYGYVLTNVKREESPFNPEGRGIIARDIGQEVKYSLGSDMVNYNSTAYYTEDRIDNLIGQYASKSSPNYSQGYVTRMSPRKFLELTTDGIAEHLRIIDQSRKLDTKELRNNKQPIYLRVNTDTGEVEGHEGRHRMVALQMAGVREVPIVIVDNREGTKYNKTKIDKITLKGQFREYDTADVQDLEVLSYANRETLIQKFATPSRNDQIDEDLGIGQNVKFQLSDDSIVSDLMPTIEEVRRVTRAGRDKDVDGFWKAEQRKIQAIADARNAGKNTQELERQLQTIRSRRRNAVDKVVRKEQGRTYERQYLRAESNRKIADLKAENSQKIKDLKAEHRSELQAERNRTRERIKQMEAERAYERRWFDAEANQKLDELRERKDRQIEAERQKRRDERAKRRETKGRNEYMASIKKIHKRLTERLLEPSDTKHIPAGYSEAVANLLESFNFITSRMKADGKTVTRLLEYKKLYNEYSDRGDIEGDPDLIAAIDTLAETIDGVPFEGLNSEQLRIIRDVFKAVEHTLNTINKTFNDAIKENIDTLGTQVMAEAEASGKHKESKIAIVQTLNKFLNQTNVTPSDAFAVIGGTTEKLYQAIRDGFNTHVRNIRTAMEFMSGLVDKKTLDEWSNRAKEYKTEDGATITLTDTQLMSLYCLMKREQAAEHIVTGGGIVCAPNIKIRNNEKKKLSVAKTLEQSHVMPTYEDIVEWLKGLSKEQLDVADKIQEFMSTTGSDWGNETSMKLYGYQKFTEENYFPITSSKMFLATNFENRGANTPVLKNMGFTKKLTKGANNPIVIDDIFDVACDHINKMSMYNALVPALTDFQRVYNFTRKSKDEEGVVTTYESVQEALRRAYGDSAVEYIDRFMQDVNGSYQKNYDMELPEMAMRAYKKASVGGNLRVLLQQPTAIFRAGVIINPKYLLKAIAGKPATKEMQEHCEIGQWKSWGFYNTDVGRDMKDVMMGNESMTDKVFMGSYGKADDLTWGYIWKAVKLEVENDHPDLKRGSEEYWDAVNKRASYVFDRTQVVDSVFHRSQIMRNKDVMSKMLTAFMAEPTKTYNMLRTETLVAQKELAEGNKKGATLRMGRVIQTFITTAFVTAVAQSFIDAFRTAGGDDKEYKGLKWIERFFKKLKSNFLDNINPFTLLPIFKDIVSLADGYKVTRTDMDGIQKVYNAITGWQKYIEKSGDKSFAYNVLNTARAISYVTGFPIASVIRDTEAITLSVVEGLGGTAEAEFFNAKLTTNPAAKPSVYAKLYYNALAEGDKETAGKIKGYLTRNNPGYMTPENGKKTSKFEDYLSTWKQDATDKYWDAVYSKGEKSIEALEIKSGLLTAGVKSDYIEKRKETYDKKNGKTK